MPASSPSPSPRRRRRPARAAATVVLAAALLAAATLTAPAALARPPTRARPRPSRAPRPAPPPPGPTGRGRGSSAGPRRRPGLAAGRGDAAAGQARRPAHRRLEVLAEDLEEAYARGVELLSDASKLDRRRREAERELAVVQAKLHERARSSYMAGPGWFMSTLVGADDPADALARLPLQRAVLEADLALVDQVSSAKAKLDSTRTSPERLVDQALGAEQLDAKRAEAERLAAEIERAAHHGPPRPPSSSSSGAARRPASGPPSPTTWLRPGPPALPRSRTGAPRRRPRRSRSPWPSSAPLRLGRRGPSTFDCSG